MQRFACPTCGAEVFSADLACVGCGTDVVFDPASAVFRSLTEAAPCRNRAQLSCNWRGPDLCRACVTTSVVPPSDVAEAVTGWASAERAKRRLFLQLLSLGLLDPVPGSADPSFEMQWSDDGSVTIGHADGVITIDVAEADDARRERLKDRLGEPYRTMLGHLRHEIGHFYWPRLAGTDANVGRVREVFGDDRVDYAAAIDAHYAEGPPADWPQRYVSAYATMHPWEDWAECFAHLLHLLDTLDTAASFRLTIGRPVLDAAGNGLAGNGLAGNGPVDIESIDGQSFDALRAQWTALGVVANALNRSMDLDDLYPFAPSDAVWSKVETVYDLVTAPAHPGPAPEGPGTGRWLRRLRRD